MIESIVLSDRLFRLNSPQYEGKKHLRIFCSTNNTARCPLVFLVTGGRGMMAQGLKMLSLSAGKLTPQV